MSSRSATPIACKLLVTAKRYSCDMKIKSHPCQYVHYAASSTHPFSENPTSAPAVLPSSTSLSRMPSALFRSLSSSG